MNDGLFFVNVGVNMSDSPFYFRPIQRSTVGYLKALGAENAAITPVKDEKMFVTKLSDPMTLADATLNKVIDALSSVGILATSQESAIQEVIANTSPNYATTDKNATRLISKRMLVSYINQSAAVAPSETVDYFNFDFLSGTGPANVPSTAAESMTNREREREVLQLMVDIWDITFSRDTITAAQFIETYDAIERLECACASDVYTGLLRLPGGLPGGLSYGE